MYNLRIFLGLVRLLVIKKKLLRVVRLMVTLTHNDNSNVNKTGGGWISGNAVTPQADFAKECGRSLKCVFYK